MHRATRAIVLATALIALSIVPAAQPVAAVSLPAKASDFNGDGYADLAIGTPHEAVGDAVFVGAVNVLYGSATGLSTAGNQHWSQDSVGILGTRAAYE